MEANIPEPFVIEGLRLLPWVNYRREKMRDDGLTGDYGADGYMDCSVCMRVCNSTTRRTMGCGWLPPDQRGEPMMPPNVPAGVEPSVCAGYSTRLPEVLECGRAMSWRDKGCLPDMYHGHYPTPALRDGIDILSVEQSAVDAHRMRAAKDGN